jgi:AcrR family transcriptional regulator
MVSEQEGSEAPPDVQEETSAGTRPGDPLKPLRAFGDAVSSVLKKRTRKSADERRKDILEAAVKLFGERGFNETPLEEVAAAAGIAKPTIYLYFDTKEHILLALKRRFSEGLEHRVAGVITDVIERISKGEVLEYRDVIDDIFDEMVAYNVEHRDAVEVVIQQTPGPELMREALDLEAELIRMLAGAFSAATERGLIHVTDPEMTAWLVNAAIRDNIVTCLIYDRPHDLDRLVKAAKEMLYKALAPVRSAD